MYLDTISEQSRVFFYSLGMGFLLGIMYDIFGFIGCFLPRKRMFIIPRDIIFMVNSAFLMFLFSLAVHNGGFKFHIYSGALIGFFICFFSLGRFMRRIFFSVATHLKSLFGKFKRSIRDIIRKNRKKHAEKAKKSEISSNLLLQDDETMLYNIMDNGRKGSEKKE